MTAEQLERLRKVALLPLRQWSALCFRRTLRCFPGLILTTSIAAIAIYTGAQITYVTPLIVAMAVGILFRNAFILPTVYKEGITFSMRPVLRFAVALLGVRITFSTIASLGWEGLAIALVPLVLTLVFTLVLGRLIGTRAMYGGKLLADVILKADPQIITFRSNVLTIEKQ